MAVKGLDVRHRNNTSKKTLAAVYEKFAAELATLVYTGPTKLYHEMEARLEHAAQLLMLNKLPLAFETLYGVGLGIDGLQSHWGASWAYNIADDE